MQRFFIFMELLWSVLYHLHISRGQMSVGDTWWPLVSIRLAKTLIFKVYKWHKSATAVIRFAKIVVTDVLNNMNHKNSKELKLVFSTIKYVFLVWLLCVCNPFQITSFSTCRVWIDMSCTSQLAYVRSFIKWFLSVLLIFNLNLVT